MLGQINFVQVIMLLDKLWLSNIFYHIVFFSIITHQNLELVLK